MSEVSLGSLLTRFADSEQVQPVRSQAAQQAQWFVDHEIAIVPTRGKNPIGGVTAAKLDTDKIKDGYGIALGNGYIAIDYDEHDGAENFDVFKSTRYWRSGSNLGYGIIYRVPKELSEHGGKISTGITIRAAGSIIVGPGSKHPGNKEKNIKPGGIYELINDIEIQEAPEFIIKLLEIFKDRATHPTEYNHEEIQRPDSLFSDLRFKEKFDRPIQSDRSGAIYEICAYATERGATNEEIAWIIANHEAAKDKGHIKEETTRLLGKLRELHKHPGIPCDKAECPNKPQWMGKEIALLDFFSYRPEFEYIKQAAQSRIVEPKAAMLAVLTNLCSHIPTEVVIPPIIGSVTSLNFFVCFVGEPGAGKGRATALAKDLFDFSVTGIKHTHTTPGSGEGVVSTYLKVIDNAWKQKFEGALINYDEIDQLKATSERSGSTLSATLRQGFMGEYIGGQYSKTTKELAPLSYRMAFQLSAQPLKSQWLLDDAAGGLPQRFVFVSTIYRDSPDYDDLPSFPDHIKWNAPQVLLDLKKTKADAQKPNEVLGKMDEASEAKISQIEIEVDEQIKREIIVSRIKHQQMGKSEGHYNLVRLKVAILLAILNGRMNVTEEDWKLAYIIMSWSKQATDEIKDALGQENLKIQIARATAAGDRAEYLERRSENKALLDVSENLLKRVNDGVVRIIGRDGLTQKIRHDKRHLINDAIELLIKENKVEWVDEGKELKLK